MLCLHVPWSAGGREGEQVDVRGPVSERPAVPALPAGEPGGPRAVPIHHKPHAMRRSGQFDLCEVAPELVVCKSPGLCSVTRCTHTAQAAWPWPWPWVRRCSNRSLSAEKGRAGSMLQSPGAVS